MVEVVQIEKFKSKDGYVYDTLKDAERADRRWKEENEFELAAELTALSAQGLHMWRRMIHSTFFEERGPAFPRLVIFHGKHGDDINVIANPSKLPGVYLDQLKMEQPYGFYDTDPKSKALAKAIADNDNEFAALAFMTNRSDRDYQYEKITAEHITIL